jgi:outer membrane autotransporter protein
MPALFIPAGRRILTVTNYTGLDGTLSIHTFLGADNSPSDLLRVDGGLADPSALVVASINGLGDQTVADGILVVEAVNGGATTTDAFYLGAPVVAGPYEYSLYRGGLTGYPDNWYLRSELDCDLPENADACANPPPPNPVPPDFRPEVSLYAAIPDLVLRYGANSLGTFHERRGEHLLAGRRGTLGVSQGYTPDWGRIVGTVGSRDGGPLGIYSDEGPTYDYAIAALQAGRDFYRAGNADGTLDIAGAFAAFGGATADVTHFDETPAGTLNLGGVTLGGYWTRIGEEGWYLDGVVQGTFYNLEAVSGRLPDLETDGVGFAASLEGGYPFDLGDGLVLEPQAQLTYQTIGLGTGTDGAAQVSFSDIHSLTGRLGLRLAKTWEVEASGSEAYETTAWAQISLVNEFLGTPTTPFTSEQGPVDFGTPSQGLGGHLKVGFDVEVVDNVTLYGAAGFQGDFGGRSQAFSGLVGLKGTF